MLLLQNCVDGCVQDAGVRSHAEWWTTQLWWLWTRFRLILKQHWKQLHQTYRRGCVRFCAVSVLCCVVFISTELYTIPAVDHCVTPVCCRSCHRHLSRSCLNISTSTNTINSVLSTRYLDIYTQLSYLSPRNIQFSAWWIHRVVTRAGNGNHLITSEQAD